jgi:hypothetical protein
LLDPKYPLTNFSTLSIPSTESSIVYSHEILDPNSSYSRPRESILNFAFRDDTSIQDFDDDLSRNPPRTSSAKLPVSIEDSTREKGLVEYISRATLQNQQQASPSQANRDVIGRIELDNQDRTAKNVMRNTTHIDKERLRQIYELEAHRTSFWSVVASE